MQRWWPALILLLILWLTRITALDTFPFHVDEGIHVRWAIEVWNGHPFWNISDAKIIGHWPIAAFYPQNAAPFVARIPTVMIAMLGLAAGYVFIRRLFGFPAAIFAGVMWIMTPYLLFYDRMALPDAEAGALGVITLFAAYRLGRRMRYQDAVFLGVIQALAILFKLTAVPYVFVAILIVLWFGWQQRWRILRLLAVSVGTGLICFLPPILYIILRGEAFFAVQSGFVGVTSDQGLSLWTNVARFGSLLNGYGESLWLVLVLIGFVSLILLRRWKGIVWLFLGSLPLLAILVIGRTVFPRYYGAGLGILMLLAGAGLGLLIDLAPHGRLRQGIAVVLIGLLGISGLPFMLTLYTNAAGLTLPEAEREQYYTGPSSGFGISDAARALPDVIERTNLAVIASMRPDSCYQANFYARDGMMLTCTDAPGIEAIEVALQEDGAVYVLTDHAPLIGVDVATLDAKATRIAGFPRPSETAEGASVVLWLLES